MNFNTEELIVIQDALDIYLQQMDFGFFPQDQEYLEELDKKRNLASATLEKIKGDLK